METLLKIWPTTAEVAAALRMPYSTVSSWSTRGIPMRRFPEIIAAAAKCGRVLTFEALLEGAARPSGAPLPEAFGNGEVAE